MVDNIPQVCFNLFEQYIRIISYYEQIVQAILKIHGSPW